MNQKLRLDIAKRGALQRGKRTTATRCTHEPLDGQSASLAIAVRVANVDIHHDSPERAQHVRQRGATAHAIALVQYTTKSR